MNKLKIVILGVVLVLHMFGSTVFSQIQTITQPVWEIENPDYIDKNPMPGDIVDLSNAVIIKEYESIYRYVGDTLVSRTLDGVKERFETKGDTIYNIGTITRLQDLSIGLAMPYFFPFTKMDLDSVYDILTYRYCDIRSDTLKYEGAVKVKKGCKFIFATNDTINATCEFVSVLNCEGNVQKVYRWYSDLCPYPIVEVSMMLNIDSDSGHIRTFICPPVEQVYSPHKSFAKSKELQNQSILDDFSSWDSVFDLNAERAHLSDSMYKVDIKNDRLIVTDSSLSNVSTLSTIDSDQMGSTMRFLICDIGGTIYGQSKGSIIVESSQLHDGVYVLLIEKEGKIASMKLYVYDNKLKI